MAGLREPEPEAMALRRAFDGQRPPASEDRVWFERREEVTGPPTEGREHITILDRPLLPSHLGSRRVERHLLEVCGVRCADGYAARCANAPVGVDDQVDGRAGYGPGIGVEGRVFQPHARVEKLRLVAAHDDRPCDPVGHVRRPFGVAVTERVFRRDREHFAASGGDELPELEVADPRVERRAQQPIVVDERLDRVGGRRRRCVDGRIDQPFPRSLGCQAGASEWRHEAVGRGQLAALAAAATADSARSSTRR